LYKIKLSKQQIKYYYCFKIDLVKIIHIETSLLALVLMRQDK
jgi:hypothetical protein